MNIIDLPQWRAANEEAREPVAAKAITSHLFTTKGETLLAAMPRIREALASTPGARLALPDMELKTLNPTRLGNLARANAATRALRAHGLRVTGVDLVPTPRLRLTHAPGPDLPLRGLTRTRAAQGYTCCALFEGVALEWRERA